MLFKRILLLYDQYIYIVPLLEKGHRYVPRVVKKVAQDTQIRIRGRLLGRRVYTRYIGNIPTTKI